MHFFTVESILLACLSIGLLTLSGINILLLIFSRILRKRHPYVQPTAQEIRLARLLNRTSLIVFLVCFVITAVQKEWIFGFPNGSEGYHALSMPMLLGLPSLCVWKPD